MEAAISKCEKHITNQHSDFTFISYAVKKLKQK
jgi:hypothetical protein